MSLLFDVERISEVLLVDGWHKVEPGSFDLDAYEFAQMPPEGRTNQYGGDLDPFVLHGGGNSGVCATGFEFKEADSCGEWIAGPLTAILAIRHYRRK